ncbi:hypothetical protein Hanom_Chr09g00793901 [Helianthus anomalus]
MSLFNLHGLFPRRWGKDVVNLVYQKHRKKNEVVISSMCETLKVDEATEENVRRFMPKLTGLDVVANIGKPSNSGLDFKPEVGPTDQTSQDPNNIFKVTSSYGFNHVRILKLLINSIACYWLLT